MMAVHKVNSAHDNDRDAGVLVLTVRKDDTTKAADEPISIPQSDGEFAVLEVDERGYLRVRIRDDQLKLVNAPSVEDLLEEQNSLLRRVVLALEMIHETSLVDPG